MLRIAGNRGSVFVFTLWAVMTLAIFAVGLAGMARQRVLIYQRIEKKSELKWIAESAVKKIIFDLRSAIKDPAFIREKKWYHTSLDSTQMTVGRGRVSYLISDESGKINLNTATFETLTTLFQNVAHMSEEPASRLAAAVIDFRDEDDHVNTFLGPTGSERYAYELANLPYAPLNRDFEFVSELRFVQGMTDEVFQKVSRILTPVGESSVNLNMATPDAMVGMGLQPETAEKIVDVRRGLDKKDGTDDDELIDNLDALTQALRARYGLSQQEEVSLQHAIKHGFFSTRPELFRIVVDAQMPGSNDHQRVVCLYGISKGLVYWHET